METSMSPIPIKERCVSVEYSISGSGKAKLALTSSLMWPATEKYEIDQLEINQHSSCFLLERVGFLLKQATLTMNSYTPSVPSSGICLNKLNPSITLMGDSRSVRKPILT